MTDVSTQTIRPLAIEDSQPLGEFFAHIGRDEQTRRFFHPHPLTPEFAQHLCQRIDKTRDEYFVCWEEQGIIGYGMLRGWDEGYEVPSFGVCVLPSRRGEGLGQRLLRYALERCRLRGAKRVRLTVYRDNIWAVHVYRKFGFVFSSKNTEELVGILDLVP